MIRDDFIFLGTKFKNWSCPGCKAENDKFEAALDPKMKNLKFQKWKVCSVHMINGKWKFSGIGEKNDKLADFNGEWDKKSSVKIKTWTYVDHTEEILNKMKAEGEKHS